MTMFVTLTLFLLAFKVPLNFCEVVSKFNTIADCADFFEGRTTPEIPHILEDGAPKASNYKPICQRFKNKYRFATLYDTTNKIPVFSAYTYRGSFKAQKRVWMIEPQLELQSGAEMVRDKRVCNNQASLTDYNGEAAGPHTVNRGHLFPMLHAQDADTSTSTCTLTNIVPQKVLFNSGRWCAMENAVKNAMDTDCLDHNNKPMAYVVTGAVPDSTSIKNKIIIPRMMWTVFACYNIPQAKWIARAHWSLNIDSVTPMAVRTLGELNSELKRYYPDAQHTTVSIFPHLGQTLPLKSNLERENTPDCDSVCKAECEKDSQLDSQDDLGTSSWFILELSQAVIEVYLNTLYIFY